MVRNGRSQLQVTRRTLLQGGSLALVAAGWAPSLRRASADVPKASGVINFMSWEGYDFPDQMKAWREANKVEVQSTYMGSHDDIQAKILGGGGEGLDLITYGSSYKQLYRELKILQPLDVDKIPNLKNLLPFFGSNVQNIWVEPDGTRTGVPADWGAVGISYDSDVIKDAPTSYDILFDPKFKGKVGMPDDALGAYGQAAHVLGLNSSRMTEVGLQDGDRLAEGPGEADQGHIGVLRRCIHPLHRRRHRALVPRLGGLQIVRGTGRQEDDRDDVAEERRRPRLLQCLGHSARARTIPTRSMPGSTRR